MIELWIPVSIKKPQTTSSSNYNNKITDYRLLSKQPIVCKSDLHYNKIGYRWVDTSYKNRETTYVEHHEVCGK
jgi:hypothetical protein